MNGHNRHPLCHLLAARLRHGGSRSLLQSIGVLLSSAGLSFFVFLTAELAVAATAKGTLPYRRFLSELTGSLLAVSAILLLLSLLSLYMDYSMGQDDRIRFYAALSSLGATSAQRRRLSLWEMCMLFALPATLGTLVGAAPAALFCRALLANLSLTSTLSPYARGGILLLLLLCVLLPLPIVWHAPQRRYATTIRALRLHNEDEAQQAHHYRRSRTFRQMPIEQRIAKKSVVYYQQSYRRISLLLFNLMAYPLMGIMLFLSLSGSRILLDSTPLDGVDTAGAALSAVSSLLFFVVISLLLLSLMAAIRTWYMLRLQAAARRDSLRVYRAVGMTESSIRRLLMYEYRTAALHALAMLLGMAILLFSLLAA